ncbi:MAG: hypothetical protein SGPRY_013761, partial [Prymnesium sp.]
MCVSSEFALFPHSDQFAVRRQNDPHEFFLFLLCRLAKELTSRPLPAPLSSTAGTSITPSLRSDKSYADVECPSPRACIEDQLGMLPDTSSRS